MSPLAFTGRGDRTKLVELRIGIKGLLVLVASCAFIMWAGVSIRDQAYHPLRVIRSGNAFERRRAALDLSGQRRPDADAAMAALINALRDEDAGVRATVAASLSVLVYEQNHPPGGAIAADLYARRIEAASRALIPCLSDRDPGVRAAAATSLGIVCGGPSHVPLAPGPLALLLDRSSAVRRQAARRIYRYSITPFPPELADVALKDESVEVRAAAARALGRFGTDLDPVIPTFFAMMEHDAADVRKACAEALDAAWPTPALVSTLVGLLQSRNRNARFYAAQLLGRIGPEGQAAIPSLIALLKEPLDAPYPDPARGAAWALGQMGPSQEAMSALMEMITPEKVERAFAILKGLTETRPPSAGDRVLLLGESLRIMSAIQGLGDIGPPAVAAVPAVIAACNRALARRHSMAQTVIPAALARIAPHSPAAPDAVAALIQVLDAYEAVYEVPTIEALGHFGKDASAAIPRLRVLQQDPRRVNRGVITKSLRALEAESPPDAGGEQDPASRP